MRGGGGRRPTFSSSSSFKVVTMSHGNRDGTLGHVRLHHDIKARVEIAAESRPFGGASLADEGGTTGGEGKKFSKDSGRGKSTEFASRRAKRGAGGRRGPFRDVCSQGSLLDGEASSFTSRST